MYLVKAFRVASIFALAMFSAPLWAHGGLSMDEDRCKLRVGPHTIHFAGYQPGDLEIKEFCHDVPATGSLIVVLDYVDDALRDLPVEVRIVKDMPPEGDINAHTVFHLPAKVYPTGSLNFEHEFSEPGKYIGLVSVGGKTPHTARFPFAVGQKSYVKYILPFALVIAAGWGLYYFTERRRKRLAEQKPA